MQHCTIPLLHTLRLHLSFMLDKGIMPLYPRGVPVPHGPIIHRYLIILSYMNYVLRACTSKGSTHTTACSNYSDTHTSHTHKTNFVSQVTTLQLFGGQTMPNE